MIKGIKYSASVLLMMVFIVFSGETAYSNITEKTYKSFNCIVFNKAYESSELAETLQETANKHNCFGFYTVYDYSNKDTEINVCTHGSVEKVKSVLDMDDCVFDTIIAGSFDISFADIDDINDKVSGNYIIQVFYVDGAESDIQGFAEELKQKYDITVNARTDYFDNSVIAALICIFTVILLNVYDILNMKRNVSISLTLGNPLSVIIAGEFAKDTAVYTTSAVVLSLILSKVTAIALIKNNIIIYTVVLLLMTLISYMSFYFIDICSSLKNENHSDTYMPINYSLKVISAGAVILLVVLSGKLSSMKNKYECISDFKNAFSGYSRIEMSESPYWARLIDSKIDKNGYVEDESVIQDLFDEEFKDQTEYLGLIEQNDDIFYLNAFDSILSSGSQRVRNIMIASDKAKSYIERKTNVSLAEDSVSIIIPGNYNLGDLQVAKKALKYFNQKQTKDSHISELHYDSSLIASIEYYSDDLFVSSGSVISVMDSPIILFFPKAKDYNFFDCQSIMTATSSETARAILLDNNILSVFTDISGAENLSDDYIRNIRSQIIIYSIVLVSCCFYYFTSTLSIILIDQKINRRRRAISLTLGNSFAARYIDIIVKLVISLIISAIAVIAVSRDLGIYRLYPVMICCFALMITEMLMFLVSAAINERENTVNILKGGAL